MSAELFSRKFYKHHTDSMLLADAIPDPIKDDVTIYELPGLNTPDAVVLPVIHGFRSTRTMYTYSSNRFEEFGLPFFPLAPALEPGVRRLVFGGENHRDIET